MTETEARTWIEARFGRAATDRLATFLAMVIDENTRQNLVAPSTIATIWYRHALDSAQLVPLAPATGTWLDIGSGGGFPGMVVALLRDAPTILVEPRRRRADFLQAAAAAVGLDPRVTLRDSKVEAVEDRAEVISARAVASIENLLLRAAHCGTMATRWILPRGRIDDEDLAEAGRRWRFVFHVEQSMTSPDSSIVILERVSKR